LFHHTPGSSTNCFRVLNIQYNQNDMISHKSRRGLRSKYQSSMPLRIGDMRTGKHRETPLLGRDSLPSSGIGGVAQFNNMLLICGRNPFMQHYSTYIFRSVVLWGSLLAQISNLGFEDTFHLPTTITPQHGQTTTTKTNHSQDAPFELGFRWYVIWPLYR